MTWINIVSYEQAQGQLKKLYDRVKGPDNNVDNIMLAHGLRPHTMEGHMAIYKYVLHHPRNTIEKWFLEAIGVYTSMLNHCNYCVEHHFQGMQRLLKDEQKGLAMRHAMESNRLQDAFDDKQAGALEYASKLTLQIAQMNQSDILTLKELGWDDGEILEINQVTAYFNYANRTVLGLGINTDGDILGLSPNDGADLDNWNHS